MSEAVAATPPGRSPWRGVGARLVSNRGAMTSFAAIALILLAATLGPMLWPHRSDAAFHDHAAHAPSFADLHWLGADAEGRDVAARLLLGLGVTWLVGVIATFVSLALGVLWGAIAGLSGGGLDVLMTRIVRGLAVIPLVFFVILLVVVTPTHGPAQNLWLVAGAIGVTQWLDIARVIRDRTAGLRRIAFIDAARAAGATRRQIVFRHIVPNLAADVVLLGARALSLAILMESFLSFLGLGVKAPLVSLGRLIAEGARAMETAPWTLIAPAFALAITLIALNVAADGLRDAIVPRER